MATISRIAAGDVRSTTGSNNRMTIELCLTPSTAMPSEVRERLRAAELVETEQQMVRLGLLMELLERRGIEYYEGEEKDEELTALIDFLCVN